MKVLSIIAHILWIFLLTLFTQVGGLLWLGVLLGARVSELVKRFRWPIFAFSYLLFAAFIVPPLAKIGGRVPLPVWSNPHLRPENMLYALFNRHYVRPPLRAALEQVAADFHKEYPGAAVYYLDAGFPFIDGYPLEPHFSHYDGKKADILLCWNKASGAPLAGSPSPYGYGACAAPLPGEYDYNAACRAKGYWYTSLDKSIADVFVDYRDYEFDPARTRVLARLLAEHPDVEKILLEPHLKTRLNLQRYDKIRAQGCKAARHDDHFHVQSR